MNWKKITGLILVVLGLAVLTLKLTRVYDPAPSIEKLSAKAGPAVARVVKNVGRDTAVYIVLVGLPICIGALLLAGGAGSAKEKTVATPQPVSSLSNRATKKKAQAAVHTATVLQVRPDGRQVWQFDARNGGFALNRQQSAPTGEPLPPNLVGKDWRNLFQRKLNIAWLPADQIFLRVIQLPLSNFTETLSMVELQLEKLSPMPVAQVAWSLHVLPHSANNMQTVIVVIVSRNAVEDFLGKLEGQGYLADSLELPIIDQLQATPVTEDGVWVYPEAFGGHNTALAAWWSGGVLRNLDMIALPASGRAASLKEQLTQMAWAGELEGWLSGPPRWYLVAPASPANEWEPALREGLDQPIVVTEPVPAPQLAAATARRSAHGDPGSNLLPKEFSTRYQQQFVDRLWMRGLFAVAGLYVIGVVIYMVALEFVVIRTQNVEQQAAAISNTYTNAIQMKARLGVLNERQELKYAALDSWKAVAELLPEDLTLEVMGFSNGKRLSLNGTAPNDATSMDQLLEFQKNLRRYSKDQQPLFNPTELESSRRVVPPNSVSWNFGLDLKRTEVQ